MISDNNKIISLVLISISQENPKIFPLNKIVARLSDELLTNLSC
jgi:hypothetical protein